MDEAVNPIRLLSAAEQVAAHVRKELERGHWSGGMPGVGSLAAKLGVSRKTAEAALRQLERDGVLAGQGPSRRRRIVLAGGGSRLRPARVALLLFDPADRHLEYILEIEHALDAAGHAAIFPAKTLFDLGMDVGNISDFVRRTKVDAWVVMSASRAVLEWFSARPFPSFALFGPQNGLPIAGIRLDKPHAFAAATRTLIELGHRRIALLARRMGALPAPRLSEQVFLTELQTHGIKTGGFNLPVWEETPEGLQKILNSLFQVTPPTALIVDEVALFAATQQFLAARGIRVPKQVSLICTDPDPTFAWCVPTIAHIRWDSGPVVRHVVRWVASVSRGQQDRKQTITPAEFVPGGTIGPAPVAGGHFGAG